jgi:foldase protein PrsA
MRKIKTKVLACGLALVLAMGMMAGCGKKSEIDANGQPKLFTYDGTDVYMNEAWLYATMQQITYEQQYASQYSAEELWAQQVDEETDEEGNTVVITLEDMVKEEVIERIKMTKVMCNKAEELEITLSEEDTADLSGYVDAAMENLKDVDLEGHGVTKETVEAVYKQEILAQKVYEEVGNGEINLTYNLLFETFEEQSTGERKEFSKAKKAKQKAKAEKALKKLQNGADVVELAEKMKADKSSYVAISEATKANYAMEYVAAAEKLEATGDSGAISPITESDFGYHILVYVTEEDEKYQSDDAQNAIVSEQQNLFASKYEQWVKDLEEDWDSEKDIAQEEWDKVTFIG